MTFDAVMDPEKASAASSRGASVVVLASGHGSNLHALLEDFGRPPAVGVIAGVVSDRKASGALGLASEYGVPSAAVTFRPGQPREQWDAELADVVASFEPDLVVLAGFMRLVSQQFLVRFDHRVLNVHPSLLPAFPGTDAVAQALDSGVKITGCTIHWVDSGMDSGPIVAQGAVPAMPGDDHGSLHRRIQALEHRLLPAVVRRVLTGVGVPSSSCVRTDGWMVCSPALVDLGCEA